MANLNSLSTENMNRAVAIMHSASGRELAPRMDYPPYIEEVVAGAALALEKGHAHALQSNRSIKADEWLNPKSMEGSLLRRAVARVLGGYEPGVMMDKSPKGLMEHIVTDTVNMASASRMELAVSSYDPALVEGMSSAQVQRVENAREDNRVFADITHESLGNYTLVSATRRSALIDVFHNMENVSDVARLEIDRAASHIDQIRAETISRNSEIDKRVANFREDGEPLFRDVIAPDARDHVSTHLQDMAMGIGKGSMNELEAGVQIHIAARGPMNQAFQDGMVHNARVAVVVDGMLSWQDRPEAGLPIPTGVAMRIEGMAVMMRKAENYNYSYARALDDDSVMTRDMNLMASGSMSQMSPDAQVRAFRSLYGNENVSSLAALQIHNAAADLSSAERSVAVEKTVPVEKSTAHAAISARTQERSLSH